MRPWPLLLLLAACDGDGPPDRPGHPRDTAEDSAVDTSGDTAESGVVVTVQAPGTDAAFDECEEVCFAARLTRDGSPISGVDASVELDDGGIIGSDTTDDQGVVTACTTGIAPGSRQVAFSFRLDGHKVRSFSTFVVYPFGYAMGLTKPTEALSEIPWTPTLVRSEANPVLTGDESWDSEGVILSSVVQTEAGWTMVVAGTPEEDYQVGAATSADGLVWTPVPGNPVLPATGEGWNAAATNSPVVLNEEGTLRVWYTGRSTDDILSLGLASSTDGLSFVDAPENPVFSPDPVSSAWEGNGVAHPSILNRDGLYELWYSTDEHLIGYALSADGLEWQRYCGNPILAGESGTWEDGQVKSAEVAFDGEQYVMTYTGGETGDFQVGWAASSDGLRWVKAPEPLIAPGEDGSWEGQSVLGASLVLDGDTVRVWYSGTSAAGSAIGYAEGSR